MEGFGDIRSIVHGEPSAMAWRQLIALIASHDADAQQDAIVPYVNQQLDQRWPNTLRVLDTSACDALDTLEHWGPLVRSIVFQTEQTIDPMHVPNLTHIRVVDGYAAFQEWLDCAEPGLVKSLIYEKNFRKKHIVQFSAPALNQLEAIKLQNMSIAASAHFFKNLPTQHLKHLNLENNQLTNRNLDYFFNAIEDNHQLQSLHLGRSNFGTIGVERLCKATNLNQLRCLSLWSNNITPRGIEVLCDSGNFPRLEFLNIGGNEIKPASLEHIAKSQGFTQLKQLWIWDAEVDEASLDALFNSSRLPNLTSLNLNNIRTPAIGKALGKSEKLPRIDKLALCRTETNGDALEALLAADNLHALRHLQLTGNGLNDRDMERLSQTSSLGNLDTLYLDGGSYTTDGLNTLLSSPHFSNIRWALMDSDPFLDTIDSPRWDDAFDNANDHDPNSSSTLYSTHPDERLY